MTTPEELRKQADELEEEQKKRKEERRIARHNFFAPGRGLLLVALVVFVFLSVSNIRVPNAGEHTIMFVEWLRSFSGAVLVVLVGWGLVVWFVGQKWKK